MKQKKKDKKKEKDKIESKQVEKELEGGLEAAKEPWQLLLEEGDEDQKLITPKQAQILDAAIEIFAEKGYEATSTSEIAKKANVAEGTIFRHYKTKKHLLLSIVTPIIVKFAYPFLISDFVNTVFSDKHETFEAMLRALITNRFDFVKKNQTLLKILFQEMTLHSDIKQSFQKIFAKEVAPKFIASINRFKQKGQLVDYPAETILRLTVTSIGGFMITRFIILPDHDWKDEQEIEQTLQFLLKGLAPEER